MITLIILALITVVAYFARQKITNWLTYAAPFVCQDLCRHVSTRLELIFRDISLHAGDEQFL